MREQTVRKSEKKKQTKELFPPYLNCATHWAQNHQLIILLQQLQCSKGKRQDTELLLLLGQSSPVLPFLVRLDNKFDIM